MENSNDPRSPQDPYQPQPQPEQHQHHQHQHQQFQVVEASAPTRCEVCHQADRFDPYTNTCLRCQALFLTQNLPQAEAERFQQQQQAMQSQPRDTKVPVEDLFRVIPEAVKLCWRNYKLLFTIIAAIQVPASLVVILPLLLPPKLIGIGLPIFFLLSLFVPLIMMPIARGALTKAILDRYRGEEASFDKSYEAVITRGFKYLATVILGGLYQSVGAFLCFVGLFYTMPRGFFVPEVAIIEEEYYSSALNRSIKLATTNIWMIILLLFITGAATTIIQIAMGIIGLPILILLPGIVGTILSNLITSFGIAAITPFFATTNLLLYFHLRMRTEEIVFSPDNKKKELYNENPENQYPQPMG